MELDAYRKWLEAVILKVGGVNAFARRMEVTSNAVSQWRLLIAIPDLYRKEKLAEVSGESLERVSLILNEAREAKALLRRERLALEVGPGSTFRLVGRQKTTDRGLPGRQAPAAGTRPGQRVRRPRGKGLAGLITAASMVAAVSSGHAGTFQPAAKTSSVKRRERVA